MTGPEHYLAAERLLALAEADEHDAEYSAGIVAVAQLHATLALAAATALNEGDAGGLPTADLQRWTLAASADPEALTEAQAWAATAQTTEGNPS